MSSDGSDESELWLTASEHVLGQGEYTNLSFSTTFGKTKGRLSALGLVHCGIKRRHTKLNNSATRSKNRGAGFSIEDVRSPRIPSMADGISLLKAISKDWSSLLLFQM